MINDDGEHHHQQEQRLPMLDPAVVRQQQEQNQDTNNTNNDRFDQYLHWIEQDRNIPILLLFYIIAPIWEFLGKTIYNIIPEFHQHQQLFTFVSYIVIIFGSIIFFIGMMFLCILITVSIAVSICWRTYTTYKYVKDWCNNFNPPRPLYRLIIILFKWLLFINVNYFILIWYKTLNKHKISILMTDIILQSIRTKSIIEVVTIWVKYVLFQIVIILLVVGTIQLARIIAQFSPTFQRYVRSRYPIL